MTVEIELCDIREKKSCKPKKTMKLSIADNYVALETSDGFIMLTINLKNKRIYFETLQSFHAEQIAKKSDESGYWTIEDNTN